MDQIALFSTVRPAPPAGDDVAAMCERARERVTAEYRRPARRRGWTIALALSGAALAAAGAAVVVTAVLPGGSARPRTPAASRSPLQPFVAAHYTVQPHHDGTVTVTITVGQLRDPAGLQRALAKEGVRALVRSIPGRSVSRTDHGITHTDVFPACDYPGLAVEPPSVAIKALPPQPNGPTLEHVFTIRPSAMPKGSVVFIQTGLYDHIELLANGKLPPCVPSTPPSP